MIGEISIHYLSVATVYLCEYTYVLIHSLLSGSIGTSSLACTGYACSIESCPLRALSLVSYGILSGSMCRFKMPLRTASAPGLEQTLFDSLQLELRTPTNIQFIAAHRTKMKTTHTYCNLSNRYKDNSLRPLLPSPEGRSLCK
jgi:hypothetical protein